MPGGLGKGLSSLIPEYYDEDFDSNGAKSLEDLLKEDDDNSSQIDSTNDSEIDTESDVEDIGESTEDIIDSDDSSVINENVEDDEKIQNEKGDESDDKIRSETGDDSQGSEEVSSIQDSEEIISSTQEVKKQENVAEVLDIVDKNPRITLWSSRSAAVFRYLRKTEPEFSISREASILIDEAVTKKYPEIWKLFENL